jgi:hypothetical protein
MKRALIFLVLLGCAPEPIKSPILAPVALPPLSVRTVIRRSDKGWLMEDSLFAVVLTRAVEPVPNALLLVDDSGASIHGETVWLDRQVVAFYPQELLQPGLDLHLRLGATLRAKDGSTLAPTEILTGATRTLESAAYVPASPLWPVGAIQLSFDGGPALPATEVESIGELSDENGPVRFVALNEGTNVEIVARTAFRPGASVVFAWKGGPIAKTSLGRIHLEPFKTKVGHGLKAYVGDHEDHCNLIHGNDDKTWVCKSDTAHISFSAPVAPSEIAKHVHPSLLHSTTGDLRGQRIEIKLGEKPVTVVLDAKLEDVFGQELKYPVTFVIHKGE